MFGLFFRKILSQINVQTFDANVDELPLVMALCDSHDSSKTMYLGTEKSPDGGFGLYKVLYSGSIRKKKGQIFEEFKRQHKDCANFEAKNSNWATAIYNLDEQSSEEERTDNHLQIRFRWNNPKNILEGPPFLGAQNGELLVKVTAGGDDRLVCYPHFKELQILKGFAAGLDNQGINWMTNHGEDDQEFKIRTNGPRNPYRLDKESNIVKIEQGTVSVVVRSVLGSRPHCYR